MQKLNSAWNQPETKIKFTQLATKISNERSSAPSAVIFQEICCEFHIFFFFLKFVYFFEIYSFFPCIQVKNFPIFPTDLQTNFTIFFWNQLANFALFYWVKSVNFVILSLWSVENFLLFFYDQMTNYMFSFSCDTLAKFMIFSLWLTIMIFLMTNW